MRQRKEQPEGQSITYDKTGNVRINVMLRSVRVTIVAVEKPQVSHSLSVCL
jgi:hypothetical protein